jgi:hypothetical protein
MQRYKITAHEIATCDYYLYANSQEEAEENVREGEYQKCDRWTEMTIKYIGPSRWEVWQNNTHVLTSLSSAAARRFIEWGF